MNWILLTAAPDSTVAMDYMALADEIGRRVSDMAKKLGSLDTNKMYASLFRAQTVALRGRTGK